MALSDADVQKQIKQMMAFIDQEANEKAEEIDAKAEEEFNIEKGRLVQQSRLKIMEYYERKEKQLILCCSQSSNMLNQARLKVLKVREDHVHNVLDDSRQQLGEVCRDQNKYARVLHSLILQGLLQLLESHVVLKIRENDRSVVEAELPSICADYTAATKKECAVKIDNEGYLPTDSCGGVILQAQKGRLKIVNTLEARLELIAHQFIPEIRIALFGRNPNRKFND
ncbi:hypothetical protein B566_EDAN001194 [Ephemera danica]|nr:hypothetical protein B566_EDAN001194 [Ephemera danica]